MAGAMMTTHCCFGIPAKMSSLSLSSNTCPNSFRSLSFSSNTSSSLSLFSRGVRSMGPVKMSPKRSVIVSEEGKKKPDSAAKRARQAEKRRVYNKARKSEIRTRMKKAMEALEVLFKKSGAQPEEVLPVEKLIGEAYSIIDKAVKVGTIHKSTGARRKSRLARRKRAVVIHHGWYSPSPVEAATTA